MLINIFNQCCLQGLAETPDNYYDLAIVDPPYGLGEDGKKSHSRGRGGRVKKYSVKNWDKDSVSKEILNEIFRTSKNQIIWGANHFIEKIPYNSSCWIVWDKDNGESDFADCELAWTSFNTAVRKFKFTWNGMIQGDMKNKEFRIHPTQKPVKLYEWLLTNYAKPGDKILDTHLGSGSIAIACHNLKYDLTAYEIDTEYYNNAVKRLEQHKKQLTIF
jgi:site-specific DNA-methyltransferase (adenine-specific)